MVSAKIFVTVPASDHLTKEQHLSRGKASCARVPDLRLRTHGSKTIIEETA